jgi:hypothetical protein
MRGIPRLAGVGRGIEGVASLVGWRSSWSGMNGGGGMEAPLWEGHSDGRGTRGEDGAQHHCNRGLQETGADARWAPSMQGGAMVGRGAVLGRYTWEEDGGTTLLQIYNRVIQRTRRGARILGGRGAR